MLNQNDKSCLEKLDKLVQQSLDDQQYGGKFIVIENDAVIVAYDSATQALEETIEIPGAVMRFYVDVDNQQEGL